MKKYLFFQISWVRIRDWHILTNGLVRFTTDDRFNVLYKEGSFNWILQVRNNPHPPHKGGTFLANFQGRWKERKMKILYNETPPQYFPYFWLHQAGTVPNVAYVGNVVHARTLSAISPTISFSLFYVFHTFSHSFMSFIFLHPSADTPSYGRVSYSYITTKHQHHLWHSRSNTLKIGTPVSMNARW